MDLTFLTSKAVLIGLAVLAILVAAGVFVHKQREVGREQVRSEVLQETIKETGKHIAIEKGQNEIRNRSITDVELLDSLQQRGDF